MKKNTVSPGGLYTMSDLQNRGSNGTVIRLPHLWKQLLGEWEMPSPMTIWGRAGGGKSTLMTRFACDLDKMGYRGLILSVEEDAYRFAQRCQRLRLRPQWVTVLNRPKDLDEITKILDKNHEKLDIVFLDSFNSLNADWKDIRALWNKYPRLSWVYICHATKDGKSFKGVSDIRHDPDVVIEVSQGIARTEKNRFGPLSQIPILK